MVMGEIDMHDGTKGSCILYMMIRT